MHFCITWVIFQQFSCRDVKLAAFLIIFYLLNYTLPLIPKLYGKMKQKLAYYEVQSTPKNGFCCTLSHSMATYRNLLRRYCQLWSFFVSPQLKNWFFQVKRLCQRIKHYFVVCISFWQIQNRYKDMDPIRPLFYGSNACNLNIVTHDNGGWWRLSMVVARERCHVERLSCKEFINIASLQK